MTATHDDTIAELQRANAELRRERDAGLTREAALVEALATRNSEFGERIEQQAATIDVLKVMSSTPDDTQPVFDQIVRRAKELCNATGSGLALYDGAVLHLAAQSGLDVLYGTPDGPDIYAREFPRPAGPDTTFGRAILSRQVAQSENTHQDAEFGLWQPNYGVSSLAIPLLREGKPIGAISLGRLTTGQFTDSQIALLQTFAEQAVIAIGSVATFKALRERTADLQESLEYQTATSDVLKVISRSTFDLQPVLDTLVETAARLCAADQALISRREGELVDMVANIGFPPAYEAYFRDLGAIPVDPDSPATGHRAWREGRPVHIHDVAAVPDYPDVATRLGKQRTSLAVPMLREGETVGVIVLARQRVEPFTERQIELVSTFADQAVIAIENTRLITEQREALEQQTATAEVLQVINASPGNLAPVFDTMLDKALRLCDGNFGQLTTFDGVGFRAAAWQGFPPEPDRPVATTPPTPGMALYRLVHGEEVVHVPDITADEVYRSGNPGRRRLADKFGARTVIWVALKKDTALLGAFVIYRTEVRPFSDKQIALLRNFAAQAVIAMENARLITEQREALEQQTATAEVLQVINSSPGNLTPVFEAMLEKAIRLCGGDRGVLWTIEGGRGRLAAARGLPAEFVALLRERGESGTNSPLQRVVQGEWLIEFPDTVEEFSRSGDPHAKGAVEAGVRSAIWVAIVKEGVTVGAFAIGRSVIGTFSDKQIALLQNFAAQAVIAMENARLLTETREALEQQTATAEVLQVINASPGDLTPVFDAMLEKAHRLCGAAIGSLTLYDGTVCRTVATRGYPEQYSALLREPFPPGVGQQALIRGDRLFHSPDMQAVAPAPGVEARVRLFTGLGLRTGLSVPLRKDGVLLGMISAARLEVRPFSDKEITLLENFAAQAVIAMENARLITEQREALEQQTATAEVLGVINTSPGDLAPVFDAMLEKAMRLCEAAFGILFTHDGDLFHTAAHRGISTEFAEYIRQPISTHWEVHEYGFLDRIAHGELLLHEADLADSEAYRARRRLVRGLVELGGGRTALWVALRKDTALLGTFVIFRREVRPFTDKQIALLQNFAAQAVIAIENARLLTEQREALEQQTATAEVLAVINASPGNLTPVFDTILEKAMRLCEAGFGSLYTYDGDRFQSAAQRGVSAAYAAYRERHPPELASGGGLEEAIRTRRAVQIADMMAERPYLDGNPNVRAMVDLGGMRTGVVVPLCKDETALGVISVFRQEVRPFSDRQIALLESFAAQAVIAMENARLLTEQREALEQQQAIAEILQAINRSPGELQPVFDILLDKAMRLCEAAFGILAVKEDEQTHTVAAHGLPPALAEWRSNHPVINAQNTLLARVMAGEPYIHTLDLMDDNLYRRGEPLRRANVDLGGARTSLYVPLTRDRDVLGTIHIYRQEVRPFNDKQIALLQNFAAQAVIAMENARLLDEIRRRQEELRVTFENMGDGVAMFDETHRLVAWNRKFQEIFDVPWGLLEEHRTYADYIRYLAERGDYGRGADAEEQVRRITEVAGQHRMYERIRPDGRVIEIRHNPVAGGGFVLIYADITERKRNEAEIRAARDAAEEASRTIEAAYRDLKAAQANLIQAEKMASLGQLTAGIAHEIKNPLNFVNNFSALSTELIDELREVLAPEPLGEIARTEVEDLTALLKGNLEKVVQHGQRADGIVRSMLDHSRGSSGERRMVDLNALIDEALNLAYHGARAQDQSFNITLERDFGEGIAPIEVNPQDITRVFLNIFSNGFYATTRRARNRADAGFMPTLKVTTIDAGDAVEIRVRDNGTGIPADIRDKLFQPFFTTKPTGEGTGLGLSITYDIVTQQHGGSIAVDSKVGEYSEFTVRLPRNP